MITAEEARRLRVSKGAVNHETYKEIHARVCNRIKLAASQGETSMTFRVPPLIPGRPMFTMSHAVRYNIGKLENAGFSTAGSRGDVIHISWKPDEGTPTAKPLKPAPAKKPATPATLPASFGSSKTISEKLKDLKKKLRL